MNKPDFIHVRVTEEMKRDLKKIAGRQQRPLSNLVIMILSNYTKRHRK